MIVLIAAWVALAVAAIGVLYLVDRWDRRRWVDHEGLVEHEAERRAMARTVERCRHHRSTVHHPDLQEHRP